MNSLEKSPNTGTENNSAKGIALAVTGAVMWGIMGIFVRYLSGAGYTSFDIAFLRCLSAGILFFVFKAVTKPSVLKINLKGLVICFLYGISAYMVGFVCYGISVERIPVAVATVLMFMSPVWVAILGVVIFRERLTKQTVVTIVFCVLGAAMVANVFGSSGGSMDAIGILAGIINGFGVALQIMIPRYFTNQYERDTMLVYGFLGAALGLFFAADFKTIINSLQSPEALPVIINILGLGVLCTMVANVAVIKSTEFISTTTCSILSSLEVVVGAVVGILLFSEPMSFLQIAGGVIVVGCSLGQTLLNVKKKPKKGSEEVN